MATPRSMLCTDCAIQVPVTFRKCPICLGGVWPLFKNGPDPDWLKHVVMELRGIFDNITPEDIIGR